MKFLSALSLLVLALLGGCASTVTPPVLYVLRAEPPAGLAPLPLARSAAPPWQLMSPVRVPDYLDREALLLPQGQNGLQPATQQRWAELLSSSVPRVLAQDLTALTGEGRMWTGTAPRGLAVRGQLRVELLAFDVNAAASAVTLKARWTTTRSDGTTQPLAQAHSTTLSAPSLGPDADHLVSAHRLALWQLAKAIATTLD